MKAGTFGAILEYGVEEKVFATTLVGFDCQPLGDEPVQCVRHHAGWVSSWGHMQTQAHKVRRIPNWKEKIIRVFRSSQTYLFPFHLSDEILAQPIFYGTVRKWKQHYLKLPNFSLVMQPRYVRFYSGSQSKSWFLSHLTQSAEKKKGDARERRTRRRWRLPGGRQRPASA